MPLTERQIRAATWVKQFDYSRNGRDFRAYTTDAAPGFALLHDGGLIRYRVNGKDTDSLSLAVKWFNAGQSDNKARTPGSVEALRELRGTK